MVGCAEWMREGAAAAAGHGEVVGIHVRVVARESKEQHGSRRGMQN